jgi:uncharacterized protein
MQIHFPFQVDARGRSRLANEEEHIRQLIEQLLFTAPGERVNRPDFGTGVMQLVFAPNSPELASATEFMLRGALQRWLGELIQVQAVDVQSAEGVLRITIQYIIRRTQRPVLAQFSREF